MTHARPASRTPRSRTADFATPELDRAIADAERTAVIIWRGERISYAGAPDRIAHMSDRAERHGLFVGYQEAADAINPLREERRTLLAQRVRAAGHVDLIDASAMLAGYDARSLDSAAGQLLAESETIHFAALRRQLALLDIEQGDATLADLWRVLEGSGWNQWFDARRVAAAVDTTLSSLGLGAPRDEAPAGSPAWSAAAWRLRAAGAHAAGARAAEIPARGGGNGDGVRAELAGLMESLLSDPEWLSSELGMGQTETVGFADYVAFARLVALRRDAGVHGFEMRLHTTDDPSVQRGYFSGIVGLVMGVAIPGALYLATVERPWSAGRRFRSALAGASLAGALTDLHGGGWWRRRGARDTLRELAAMGSARDAAARFGYDEHDWRPLLRAIRTQLIGEMSGYGGPNITTRAGTRKV